jgi:protoporphyrinogen oxidase
VTVFAVVVRLGLEEMKSTNMKLIHATGCLALLASMSAFAVEGITCEVAILGGGPGGLHTAYRLAPQLGSRLCLFEKENRLGGRIYDVSRTPNGPVFGLGALRIMENQPVMFALADELGVKYAAAPFEDDLINARGTRAFDSESMRLEAYPKVKLDESALWDKIRFSPERANADKYPDFRSYVRAVLGPEEYQFMADIFRFRGDFTYPLSARGYLDFLDEDWDVCCTPSYPVGGMSEFIRRMEARVRVAGVRIYTGEPVRTIDGGNPTYRIATPGYNATASRLVIAIDAVAFKHVGGEVAAKIQAQQQFQDLIGIKVATVNQWWPKAWWKDAIPGKNTHRAWTTESCINFIEIPTAAYAADQLVTRSVYDDSLTCTAFWENLAERGGTDAVEAEIARGLEHLFPGANIPKPLKTQVQIWPAGWYWLKAGSKYTNAQIASWAIQPLAGERISMVGEAYNPQRSTWTDGAIKSSINTLNSVFGLKLEGQTAGVTPAEAFDAAPVRMMNRRATMNK